MAYKIIKPAGAPPIESIKFYEMKKKKQIKPFRKGQLAIGPDSTVLVTGQGDKSVSYRVFAGVVVWAKKNDEHTSGWPIGMYSETWISEAFKHTDLRMKKVMEAALKRMKP